MIDTFKIQELHRKLSNWSIIACLSYQILIILVEILIGIPYMYADISGLIANCAYTILLLGIYSKGCYRLIWKSKKVSIISVVFCLLLPLILIAFRVCEEYHSPSFMGPLEWACREFGHGWFNCWRLYWGSVIFRDSVVISTLVVYGIVVLRWIFNIAMKELYALSNNDDQ